MQQELISYSMSWNPLVKVLQALGVSMTKQQRTQLNNDAAMKKLEEQMIDLRDDLARAQVEKKEATAAMELMQNQVGEMKTQMEEMQGIVAVDGQEEQRQSDANDPEKTTVEDVSAEGDASSSVNQSPRPPRMSNVNKQQFVTAKDLADALAELRKELKMALSRGVGQINEVEESRPEGNDPGNDNTSKVSLTELPKSSRSQSTAGDFQSAEAPVTSAGEFQKEVEKILGLQDALNSRVTDHDQLLDALNDRLTKLNELSSQLSGNGSMTTSGDAEATDGSNGKDGSGGQYSAPNKKYDEIATNMNDILNEVKELKAIQGEHDRNLREHDAAVEKHTADIKALTDSLDDLSVQQQTITSMYSGGTANVALNPESSNENAAVDDSDNTSKTDKQTGKTVEAVSQPQLDLSLVFTKLADLRRSTDASLNSLQQTIKDVSGTAQSQQEQLDALRNNVAFNEHLQAHLVEARLAMQKELLSRNQTFQDHTKPQLVEWRKSLELTEDKLMQGNSDDETLHALEQMQRCYHRTLLSISPLVNSPLSISETLQTLSDEVKQLQNAARLGVVPLRVTDYSTSGEGVEGEAVKDDREEQYLRKLRYLDEEIDATLQVNITTEKKNDPLIKGLDAMREKLELLWSMWHRNYNVNNYPHSDTSVGQENANPSAGGGAESHASEEERRQSIQQRNPDGLREMELRLSGAVRRLAIVEEDIERLNTLTAKINTSDNAGSGSGRFGPGRRASSNNNLRTELVMEELEKLRKDMFAEITKLSGQVDGNNGNGNSSDNNSITSIVPVDRRNMVEAAAKQGDVLTDLYSQMTGRELDTRLYNTPEGQKQFYDNFIKEVTKKVSSLISSEKGAQRGPGIGGATSANVNYRLLLDSFAQKVEDRLEDAREFSTEELGRLRRELMEQLKIRFEEYDRPDDDFVFRAGFKMPANDRKILTLPFLTTAMRSKMVLNKPEGKRKRPPRQTHLNRVDNVVREAMELDRASRGRSFDPQ
ncbi:hypothetical protein PHMEG_0001274 [Phytophthora megakarya]|uniref:Neutral ceramidase n=1 Tax=Phytophthora megakarya TaxID=4795 RepID=A0A225X3I5_9STRA|nr:hypothetical protein PHMEG_0001274 [Phytophthora megakarya]